MFFKRITFEEHVTWWLISTFRWRLVFSRFYTILCYYERIIPNDEDMKEISYGSIEYMELFSRTWSCILVSNKDNYQGILFNPFQIFKSHFKWFLTWVGNFLGFYIDFKKQ